MTPKYSPIIWWPQKNIHKIFIPQNIHFMNPPPKKKKKKWNLKFWTQKMTRAYVKYHVRCEHIRVTPWEWLECLATKQEPLDRLGCAPIFSVFSFFFYMLMLHIQVKWHHQYDWNGNSWIFISNNAWNLWVRGKIWPSWKRISSATPDFFLKGILIVHQIKINS